jgi:hypothetical protein
VLTDLAACDLDDGKSAWRAGQDAVQAKGLLAAFEGTQEINFTVRDIVRRQRNSPSTNA